MHTGEYFEVGLKTWKSAQFGVLHTWRLYANDLDVKMCPMRALIHVAMLYGDRDLSGPLFLKVNKQGAVSEEPVVHFTLFNPLSLTADNIYLIKTNNILSHALTTDLQSLGYKSWGPTPSVEVDASTGSDTKTGLWLWLLHGVVGARLRP